MTNQHAWSQPAAPAPPSALITALVACGSVVALTVVETIITALVVATATGTGFYMSFGMNLGMIVSPLLPMLLFAIAAFLSLAFLKPVPHLRPFTASVAPVLIAGGIGFVVYAVFEVISEAIGSLGGDEFRVNIGSLISTSLVFTLVLALGAFAVRAGYQTRELSAGVPAGSSVMLVALVIAAATLVEAVATWVLPVLGFRELGTVFAGIWVPVLHGVFFAAAAFVAIVFLRPLSRIRSVSEVAIIALIGGALGYVAVMIIELGWDAVQGELEFFFPGALFSSLIYALDGAVVLALSILVILAWRGQRVLMRGE